jgi:vacuolar protein sorting-associated protein 35
VLQANSSSDDEWNKVGKRVFKFAHETVTALSRTDYKQLAMRLYLQCAEAASRAGFETIAYEFLTQVKTGPSAPHLRTLRLTT